MGVACLTCVIGSGVLLWPPTDFSQLRSYVTVAERVADNSGSQAGSLEVVPVTHGRA